MKGISVGDMLLIHMQSSYLLLVCRAAALVVCSR